MEWYAMFIFFLHSDDLTEQASYQYIVWLFGKVTELQFSND